VLQPLRRNIFRPIIFTLIECVHPHFKYKTRSNKNFCFLCWVGSATFVWGLEIFPLNIPNFSMFYPLGQKKSHCVGSKSTRVKAGLASYLLRVKSVIGSGQGPSLTLTAHLLVSFFASLCSLRKKKIVVMGPGQKFLTWVGLGQICIARVSSVIIGLGL